VVIGAGEGNRTLNPNFKNLEHIENKGIVNYGFGHFELV
jgi:hypothetical protein